MTTLHDILNQNGIMDFLDRRRRAPSDLETMPYKEFLKTEHWQKVRRHVICRRDGRCERCGAEGGPMEVHHKTYEHRGQEDAYIEDLELLCSTCHKAHHKRIR